MPETMLCWKNSVKGDNMLPDVQLKIKNDTVYFNFLDTRYFKTKSVYIKYDFNIQKVPHHIFNFMMGMILSEYLSWDGGNLNFTELTENEIRCINAHIRANFIANPYELVKSSNPGIVTSIKYAGLDGYRDSGLVLCSNGMGKDGLLTQDILSEIDLPVKVFTVGGYYKNNNSFMNRVNSSKEYTSTLGFEYSVIDTNIIKLLRLGLKIMPWWLFGLPIAFDLGAKNIFEGFEISFSKTHLATHLPPRPNASIFSQKYLSDATGVSFSSPICCLTQYGIQKMLFDRYPKALPYQKSCMRKNPACGSPACGKCFMNSLYAQAAGYDPALISLPVISKKGYKAIHPFDEDCISFALSKINGKSYLDWYEKASGYALQNMLYGDEISAIIKQNYDVYWDDPGIDGLGYEYIPSKWKDLLDSNIFEKGI